MSSATEVTAGETPAAVGGGRAGRGAAPLEDVDLLLSDLDGVVYTGAAPVPHAISSLRRVSAHLPVGFLTNNASRTDAEVADHLRGLGLHIDATQVVTSPQIAVGMIAQLIPTEAAVLVVGGHGLGSEVAAAGFRIVRTAAERPAAVVQGFAPDVAWRHLAEASYALQDDDVVWIATNLDEVLPQAGGRAPGNGTLVAAVAAATGRIPLVAGKPHAGIFTEARARLGGSSALMVGDRLDSDIRGSRAAGVLSALVLTGVTRPSDLYAARPADRPDFVLDDLRGLFEPYPAVVAVRGCIRVGGLEARTSEGAVEVTGAGPRIDAVRAVAAAVWMSGERPETLRVPDGLLR